MSPGDRHRPVWWFYSSIILHCCSNVDNPCRFLSLLMAFAVQLAPNIRPRRLIDSGYKCWNFCEWNGGSSICRMLKKGLLSKYFFFVTSRTVNSASQNNFNQCSISGWMLLLNLNFVWGHHWDKFVLELIEHQSIFFNLFTTNLIYSHAWSGTNSTFKCLIKHWILLGLATTVPLSITLSCEHKHTQICTRFSLVLCFYIRKNMNTKKNFRKRFSMNKFLWMKRW